MLCFVASDESGIGNSGDEDSIAAVRGAKGRSRKAVPLRVVPERGQAPDDLSEDVPVVESEEVCNVLHEDVAGSKLANGSVHFPPKRSLGMTKALALPGCGCAFAREPAGDEIDDGTSIANCSDFGVDGDAGEPLPEDSLPELVDLAEPSVLEAGETKSVREKAAAVEESTDSHAPGLPR